jgi:tRNA(Arg) A34 adenosine deaminase TadA
MALSLEQAQALAHSLFQGKDLALVECKGTVFHASYLRAEKEPSSAIFRLIQGVYEAEPLHAREILRNRVFSTYSPTELCFGAIKVSAKRVHPELNLSVPAAGATDLPFRLVDLSLSASNSHISKPDHAAEARSLDEQGEGSTDLPLHFMKLAMKLADQVTQEGPRYQCDRKIAAILVSKENEILSWALNTNATNRTLHAEINLVQSYFYKNDSPLPRGCKIFTTLKPCKMCAGAIWTAAEEPLSIQVFFAEHDDGRNARSTILDPGSAERRRTCSKAIEIEAALEHFLPI